MKGYVLGRKAGNRILYVASSTSYTPNIRDAQIYPTKEKARAARRAKERVVPVPIEDTTSSVLREPGEPG